MDPNYLLEEGECHDKALAGLGALTPGIVVGPWGVNISTDPRIVKYGVTDTERKLETGTACFNKYGNTQPQLVAACTEDTHRIETAILKGEMKVEDLLKGSTKTAKDAFGHEVPVLPPSSGLPDSRQVVCSPDWIFEARGQTCGVRSDFWPYAIAGVLGFVALGMLLRR